MSQKPENQFPTVADLRDQLNALIDEGLGDLPVQVVVVPDSTMRAISTHGGNGQSRPAVMVELGGSKESRLPVTLVSAERMQRGNEPYRRVQ
jgi:hypothetical protein